MQRTAVLRWQHSGGDGQTKKIRGAPHFSLFLKTPLEKPLRGGGLKIQKTPSDVFFPFVASSSHPASPP